MVVYASCPQGSDDEPENFRKTRKMLDKLKILWYHVRVAQRKAGNEQNQITTQKFEKTWKKFLTNRIECDKLNEFCMMNDLPESGVQNSQNHLEKVWKRTKKLLTNEMRCDKINELKPLGFNDCTL